MKFLKYLWLILFLLFVCSIESYPNWLLFVLMVSFAITGLLLFEAKDLFTETK